MTRTFKTTLADPDGVVHAVDMPVIPANAPGPTSVKPQALCMPTFGQPSMPAYLARRAAHPSFIGRTITCERCRFINGDR